MLYNSRTLVWLKFLLCLAAILVAGSRLARYADVIAEKSGLGRIWIGLALVALITATPEMATGVSAAALVKSPDLAIGTLIGSCCFNLSILFVLDHVTGREPVLAGVGRGHLPSICGGVILLAVAALGLFLSQRLSLPTLAWVSLPAIVMLVGYPLVLRTILMRERARTPVDHDAIEYYTSSTLRGALTGFALASAVVIGAGVWLSFIGDEIAAVTGWGTSFVGNLLLAIATSAPEVVVSVAAVRMGFVDIAVADILGANMLDTGMVGIVDLFYLRGSVFADASPVNLVIILVAILSTLFVGLAIWRGKARYLIGRLTWYGPATVALYIGAAYVLFTFGGA